MPGFMQSIKSHLPQSPFSPNKKNTPVITPPELLASGEQSAISAEQASSDVLPGETLVQPNSSTVALTLTPASGQSSQQTIPNSAEEPTFSQDTVSTSEPSALLEAPLVSIVGPSEPTDDESQVEQAVSQAEQPEAVQDNAQVDTITPDTTHVEPKELPESHAVNKSLTEADEVVHPSESANAEQVHTEAESVSNVELGASSVEAAVVSNQESVPSIALNEVSEVVTSTPPEVDAVKPNAKSDKENFSCHLKRNKSKKTKSDVSTSQEAKQAVDSTAFKPRKSNPLAGKFRHVIEQVRSKVKKDKEAVISPVVSAIEAPASVAETAVAA